MIHEEQKLFKETLIKLFLSEGLSVNFRLDSTEIWDSGCKNLAYFPVDYSSSMIDYQLAYYNGNQIPTADLSMIIFHEKKICGIWPLSIAHQGGYVIIKSNSNNILPPLFLKEIPKRLVRTISSSCIEILKETARHYGIHTMVSQCGFCDNPGISDWHDKLMREGSSIKLKHEIFLRLAPEINIIKSSFRKSYKSLINSGLKMWKTGLMNSPDPDLWRAFKRLHLKVAGKSTRSNESWELQYKAIISGDAFLVSLSDDLGNLIGGGLFYITRDEALYAVGVYDRILFDKPLGHVVQYKAVEEMRNKGIKWYKLGERFYPSDNPKPTDKEISISDFKQGFSSQIYPKYILDHKI